MREWRLDVRYAVRTLRARPAAASLIVAVLALGIGSGTVLFSVIDGVWLRAVPYGHSARLAFVFRHTTWSDRAHFSRIEVEALRERAGPVLESLAEFTSYRLGYALAERQPIRVGVRRVSASLLQVVGESTLLGRFFTAEETRTDPRAVVVVGERFWRTYLAADPNVAGRTIEVDGDRVTILGVVPRRLADVLLADVLRPLDAAPPPGDPRTPELQALARLRPGVTAGKATAALAGARALAREAAAAGPDAASPFVVVPVRDVLVGADVGRTFRALALAAAFVLLVTCLNAAHLHLTIVRRRVRELAIRTALGATRWRLVRQLLTETALLCGVAGLAGLGLATVTRRALVAMMPPRLPRLDQVVIDRRVLAFALIAALATTVLTGILPALAVSPRRPFCIRGASVGSMVRRRPLGAARALLAAQAAFAIAVLISAGLLVRSFARLLAVDPGFQPENVVTFTASTPDERPLRGFGALGTVEEVMTELRRAANTSAVGATDQLPLAGSRAMYSIRFPDQRETAGTEPPAVDYRRVTPGYFEAMGIPVRRGRSFRETDRRGAPAVAVINEEAAKRFWPGRDPIGTRVMLGGGELLTVVGIVANVKHLGLEREVVPEVYRCYLQEPLGGLTFVVRLNDSTSGLARRLQDPSRPLLPGVKVQRVQTLDEWVDLSVRAPRFRAALFAVFGALVVILTVVGVAGVAAESVAVRTVEIGVRMAVGASAGHVMRLVMRQTTTPVMAGLAVGWLMAWWTTRLLQQFLFEVPPRDPLVFAASVVVLLVAAVLAAWPPARHATRLDPVAALRTE